LNAAVQLQVVAIFPVARIARLTITLDLFRVGPRLGWECLTELFTTAGLAMRIAVSFPMRINRLSAPAAAPS
jgi:hypothetical protein